MIELAGTVLTVQPYRPRQPTRFTLRVNHLTYHVTSSFFTQVQPDDIVSGSFDQIGSSLTAVRPLFIQLPADQRSIEHCFVRALANTSVTVPMATNLYRHLNTTDEDVITIMTDMAQTYHTDKTIDPRLDNCGLSPKQKVKLLIWWYKYRALRRLYTLGLTNKEIRDAQMPLDRIYDLCVTNSFRVPSIPMDKCRDIFTLFKATYTPEQETCGFILRYIVSVMTGQSWSRVPVDVLRLRYPDLTTYQPLLVSDYRLIFEDEAVYTVYSHDVETTIATYLRQLMAYSFLPPLMDIPPMFQLATLSPDQETAITGALTHNFCLITGGPGTGKSTLIKEIVYNLDARHQKYVVCSFTGKAVARVQQILGSKAPMTIDRLIMAGAEFEYLIIDEISMVTTELFYRLITSYRTRFRIIVIGDIDQLPPIGWGYLMSELMTSQLMPVYRLTVNHRVQDATSLIVANAQALITDPDFSLQTGDGVYQINGDLAIVETLVQEMKNNGIEARQVTILSPYRECLTALNSMVEEVYLAGAPMVTDKTGLKWYVGDRVMMMGNNYDIGVMNGEEGSVLAVEDIGLRVRFREPTEYVFKFERQDRSIDGEVMYDNDLCLDQLSQSFAMTVHKSQGSEYEYVIFFLPNRSHYPGFLNQKLMYTAMTRTQKGLWIVAQRDQFEEGCRQELPVRYDGLVARLRTV